MSSPFKRETEDEDVEIEEDGEREDGNDMAARRRQADRQVGRQAAGWVVLTFDQKF